MSNCELAKSDPGGHLIKEVGVPKTKTDFHIKATTYCNKYAKCYGGNFNCLKAVEPERMGGKRRRKRSRRKSKRKSTKKKRRRRRRNSTKKKRRRRRRK